MTDSDVLSWNRYPRVKHERILDIRNRTAALPETGILLPFGNGRSYGDVCLNEAGTLLRTTCLDKFISFDPVSGVLACEAGVLLDEILEIIVSRGWFLAVTPGTRYITVGGGIANDVHGKNHHIAGTFGHHVRRLELLRSDGSRLLCSREENADWFAATVGGLGLTGLITWAELQLQPIANAFVRTQSRRFNCLAEFWDLNNDAEAHWPYTVSWIDCISSGRSLGRGILMQGRHATRMEPARDWRESRRRIPLDPPFSLVNSLSLRAFNFAYFHQPLPNGATTGHYVPFFYPLDAIQDWNRIYGRRGFFQYQCVLPSESSETGIAELLRRIVVSGSGSFLAVLKTFGTLPSVGMLSFPRAGATLALDFPNHGEKTLALFNELDAVVRDAGGALYPAKDARMPSGMFKHSFPRWSEFARYVDPRFSSGFWRRVEGGK